MCSGEKYEKIPAIENWVARQDGNCATMQVESMGRKYTSPFPSGKIRMSRYQHLTKLIIPFTLFIVYGITLYKTATAPTENILKANAQVLVSSDAVPAQSTDLMVSDSASRSVPPAPPAVIQVKELTDKDQVLGIVVGGQSRAYLLRDFGADPTVVNDTLGKLPVVVFLDNRSHTAIAFRAEVKGQKLEFSHQGTNIIDNTGTSWNMYGEAIDGPLAGTKLEKLTVSMVEWHKWLASHPDTEVFGQ